MLPFHSLASLARGAPFALATLANARWVLVGSREGGTRAYFGAKYFARSLSPSPFYPFSHKAPPLFTLAPCLQYAFCKQRAKEVGAER